jgi:hypothetical protein
MISAEWLLLFARVVTTVDFPLKDGGDFPSVTRQPLDPQGLRAERTAGRAYLSGLTSQATEGVRAGKGRSAR